MTVFPIFSTPVYVDTYDIPQDEIDLIKQEEYKDYPKRADGMQTVDTQLLKRYPRLHHICLGHIAHYAHNVLAIDDRVTCEIVCSWVNKHRPGERANRHGHTNSMFTGCLYLDVPDDSGNIIFEASYNHATWNTGTLEPGTWENNILNSRIWQIVPERGMIVCFPAHVDHYTGYNESTQDRYSLGFNVMMKGDFSAPTRDLVL